MSNGELVLTVPGGSNHDAAVPALDAVQVIQPISNTNFDVAVKIDSTLVAATKYYGQGLMVEGDAKDYIRFELGAGGTVNLSAGTVIAGAQSGKFQLSPFTAYAVPTYLRLTRVGTTYTAYWSANGTTWNQAGTFTDSLVVTGLAPYAWNYSSTPSQAPALTATFDWFHNLATPVAATPTFAPASGTSFSSTLSVSIADATPSATIYYTTDGSTPTTGSQLYSAPFIISSTTTVNAIAVATGYTQSAQGSASYTYSPTVPPVAATPTFTPTSGTSFSSTLSVSIADTTPSASIYYTADGSTPTTSSQLYSAPFTISATTTLNAIAIATGYTQSAQGSASYTYSPVTSGTPASDEFNETSLNTAVWQVSAPVGGSAALSNGELVITVPGGSNHDAAVPALDAVQVIQSISNVNFDVAVKIDSTLSAASKYYGQGLMVEGDAKNYIRFEVNAGGTSVGLSLGTIIAGVDTAKVRISPFSSYAVPTYLRMTRVGSTYTAYWSTDGTTWNQVGTFTDSLVVTGLAPYATNYNSTPSNAPALTATFDWFHNLTP